MKYGWIDFDVTRLVIALLPPRGIVVDETRFRLRQRPRRTQPVGAILDAQPFRSGFDLAEDLVTGMRIVEVAQHLFGPARHHCLLVIARRARNGMRDIARAPRGRPAYRHPGAPPPLTAWTD